MMGGDPPLLRDRFGRRLDYLRVSLTEQCNLRCFYCVPRGPRDCRREEEAPALDAHDLARIVRLAAGLGVRKVRLTGGEPLLRKDVSTVVRLLKGIPGIEEVSLSTNGLGLAAMAGPLRRAGLDRVNVSLDTLRPERFEGIAGRGGADRVKRGIESAVRAGFATVKVNTVVLRGMNDDELADIVRFAIGAGARPRLIEFMPLCTEGDWRDRYVSRREILDRLGGLLSGEPKDAGDRHEPARYYPLQGGGEVGIISPVSDGFCDRCNRLRLTADGHLRACLASGGEVDLAGPMRRGASDDEIRRRFLACALLKPQVGSYAGLTGAPPGRPMIRIGG